MARPPPGGNKSTGQPEKGETRLQPAKIAVIGIDLDKNSSSLAALDGNGTVVKRRRMRPDSIIAFAKDLPVSGGAKRSDRPLLMKMRVLLGHFDGRSRE